MIARFTAGCRGVVPLPSKYVDDDDEEAEVLCFGPMLAFGVQK